MVHRPLWTLAGVVTLSAFLYISASLSKDSDDETIYASLAAKIHTTGFQAYNLHDLAIEPAGKFWELSYRRGEGLLALLAQSGIPYYDAQLHFQPPLFPALLSASHRIFNGSRPFLLYRKGQGSEFHYEQFYAAAPNILFCLLFLYGVFCLGRTFFDDKTAVLAVLFCFVSPVLLVSAFKVWSDLAAATLILWSFLHWQRKDSVFHAALSGVLFGLALLARTGSIFALPLFMMGNWRLLPVWGAAVGLTSGAWFMSVYREFGELFYYPQAKGAKESLPWLASISRPWYFYPLNLLYLSPFFAAVFAANKSRRLFWAWILSFIVPLCLLLHSQKPLGVEDRYLLPCYPALAVLAAAGFRRAAGTLPKRAAMSIALLGCGWSLYVSVLLVYSRESLKFTPW